MIPNALKLQDLLCLIKCLLMHQLFPERKWLFSGGRLSTPKRFFPYKAGCIFLLIWSPGPNTKLMRSLSFKAAERAQDFTRLTNTATPRDKHGAVYIWSLGVFLMWYVWMKQIEAETWTHIWSPNYWGMWNVNMHHISYGRMSFKANVMLVQVIQVSNFGG